MLDGSRTHRWEDNKDEMAIMLLFLKKDDLSLQKRNSNLISSMMKRIQIIKIDWNQMQR